MNPNGGTPHTDHGFHQWTVDHGRMYHLHWTRCITKVINMDFIMGSPRTCKQDESIWVIVDRVNK